MIDKIQTGRDLGEHKTIKASASPPAPSRRFAG
jgi:hypothetical protein